MQSTPNTKKAENKMVERPLDKLRKQKEAEAVEKYKETTGTPPNVQEILSNENLSNLLFIYLDQKGQKKLIEQLLKRETLDENEFKTLEEARVQIKEAVDRTQEVLKILPKERIEYLAALSPDFAKIVGQIGPENTRKFLERYLAELYILEPTRFQDLKNKLDEIQRLEGEYQRLNDELIRLAEKYGIPIEQISEAYVKGNLEEVIRSNLSIIGKIRDWLGKGEFVKKRLKEFPEITEIENTLGEIDKNLQEIGKMIAGAIFQTKRGTELLSSALYGFMGQEATISFQEAGEMLKESENEEKMNEMWQQYLQEQDIKEEDLKGTKKKQIKDEFKDWYKNKKIKGRRGSFLEYIFNNILIKNIENFLAPK